MSTIKSFLWVALAAANAHAGIRTRVIHPSDCSSLVLTLSHAGQRIATQASQTRFALNLKAIGRDFDPLAELVTSIRDEAVQRAFESYLGPAGTPQPEDQSLVARVGDGFFDWTVERMGRNPSELADRLTGDAAHEIEARKANLTRVGQMAYHSPPYCHAVTTVLNQLQPAQALVVLKKLFKNPGAPRPRDMRYSVELLRVMGEVGIVDADLREISVAMRGRSSARISEERQYEIFKERIQRLIALRMASGKGIRALLQDGELLEASTKGAIFEHFLDITLSKDLLRSNLGRLAINLSDTQLPGNYSNKENILSDMLLDRGDGLAIVEAKSVDGAFGEKQLRQLDNYAELIRNGILVTTWGAFASLEDYSIALNQELERGTTPTKRRALEDAPAPKPVTEVIYIFSNRKAAEDNREKIRGKLTMVDERGQRRKRWVVYFIDIDSGRLVEVY